MPRKAPRRGKKSRKPTRPTKARPSRNRQGAGVVAGGILLSMGALLLKGLALITPNKEQLKAFWAKPRARKATYATLGLVIALVTLSSLKTNLKEDPRYQIDPSGIDISSGKISWLNDAGSKALLTTIQKDLSEDLSSIGVRDAFDQELLSEAAERIENNPWIAGVVRVARTFPSDDEGARLKASILVRKPVLRVLLDDTIYFVDGEGVALPLEIKANSDWQPHKEEDLQLLRSITQKVRFVTSASGSKPTLGQVWENEQVKAALSMEKTLREHEVGRLLPISQIDVGDIAPRKDWRGQPVYSPNGGVVLIPETSTTPIIWGKAKVHAGSFEPDVNEKLRVLRQRLEKDPSLASQDKVRLNVRG